MYGVRSLFSDDELSTEALLRDYIEKKTGFFYCVFYTALETLKCADKIGQKIVIKC